MTAIKDHLSTIGPRLCEGMAVVEPEHIIDRQLRRLPIRLRRSLDQRTFIALFAILFSPEETNGHRSMREIRPITTCAPINDKI